MFPLNPPIKNGSASTNNSIVRILNLRFLGKSGSPLELCAIFWYMFIFLEGVEIFWVCDSEDIRTSLLMVEGPRRSSKR